MGAIRRIFAPSPPAYTPPPPAPTPTPAPTPAPVAAKPAVEPVTSVSPEVETASEMAKTIAKKKKGRYSTLLTGKGGSLGSPDIERKSILGG